MQVAPGGGQINVAPGSYPGEVIVTKPVMIMGLHKPTVNALGDGRGIIITGRAAAGTVVHGLVVENATYEGILALRTSRVLIADNVVRHNDRGFFLHQFTGECARKGQPPGPRPADLRAGGCGEAIHLASTSHSQVNGNVVTGNTGGIYLTDEFGPAAHNQLSRNVVMANLYDCAITLASHSTHAVTRGGEVRRARGGVYDNTVSDNVAAHNGVRLPGAGILVAAAFRGSAAYGNRIIGNRVTDNGLPGVALHSHTGRQDLDGNVIRANVIGRNAVGGSTGGPGDGDGGITHTAGILVWSKVTKLRGIEISANRISDDYFGIWTEHAPPVRRHANTYRHVHVPVRQVAREAGASSAHRRSEAAQVPTASHT